MIKFGLSTIKLLSVSIWYVYFLSLIIFLCGSFHVVHSTQLLLFTHSSDLVILRSIV